MCLPCGHFAQSQLHFGRWLHRRYASKVKIIRTLFISLLFFPLICFSSQERIHQWEDVAYKLTLPEPYGLVELNVKFGGDYASRKIIEMTFSIGNKEFQVPQKAFSDIDQIQTNSIRIQSELHNPYNLGVGIYVVFNYWNKGQNTAHIITNDLKLVSRSLRVKTSETTWQHSEIKF